MFSKEWWSTLKYFINSNPSSSIPPLEYNNTVFTADTDKAYVLNMFFKRQTILNKDDTFLPDIQPAQFEAEFDRIVLTPLEVQLILETLSLGKASGPNGLSNWILRELAVQVSSPCCSLFLISRCDLVKSQHHIRKQMFALFQRKETYLLSLITDPFLCLIPKINYLRGLPSFIQSLTN